jgi:hypothetical protein
MNREQRRAMQLAGTVSVPQKFPQLAMISFSVNETDTGEFDVDFTYLAVDHVINAKLRIRRSFRTSDVSAIFLPWNCDCVDLQNGEWFLGPEITKALPTVLENRGGIARGIAYVPEQAATLMQVEVGMTAAESVDYYPPLPDDRSVDHYAMGDPSLKGGGRPKLSDPCSAFAAGDPCAAAFATRDPCSNFADYGGKPGKRQQQQQQQSSAFDPCSSLIW